MENEIAVLSWPLWLGVFTLVACGLVFLRKPVRKSSPKGKFSDRPMHKKPVFQVATVIILLIGIGLIVI